MEIKFFKSSKQGKRSTKCFATTQQNGIVYFSALAAETYKFKNYKFFMVGIDEDSDEPIIYLKLSNKENDKTNKILHHKARMGFYLSAPFIHLKLTYLVKKYHFNVDKHEEFIRMTLSDTSDYNIMKKIN